MNMMSESSTTDKNYLYQIGITWLYLENILLITFSEVGNELRCYKGHNMFSSI